MANAPRVLRTARSGSWRHGVVTRAQLGALGLGRGAIDHRLTRGLLHPVHRGVFAVGHPFLTFLDARDVPRPRTNHPIEGHEVDAAWPHHRLIVELDGHDAAHATRTAFENDRARDRALQAAGWRVTGITCCQLHDDPDVIAAQLRALLAVKRSDTAFPSGR